MLRGAAAVCVILLSFAAGHRKSYWSGCIKAAILICQQIFSILALVIFLFKLLLKSASKSRSGFGAAIFDGVARSSIVFCNPVFVNHIVVAASTGHRKSYWSGSIKAAILICQQIFPILALVTYLLKFLFKSVSKSSFFFCFGIEIHPGFGAAISDAIARSSFAFCKSVFADRIVVAASRLLGAAAVCVILLSFAAGHRKSYWSGRIKVGIVIC